MNDLVLEQDKNGERNIDGKLSQAPLFIVFKTWPTDGVNISHNLSSVFLEYFSIVFLHRLWRYLAVSGQLSLECIVL